MRRIAWMAVLTVLTASGLSLAQPVGTLEAYRDKAAISDMDRQQIRRWVEAAVNAMLTSTDPTRRAVVGARDSIIYEAVGAPSRSAAYVDAFTQEAVQVLAAAEKKAVSPEARLNFIMTVAELRSLDGVPLLRTALEKDPYAASRYWAAKGLVQVAPVVVDRVAPRVEAEVSDTVEKVVETETSGLILLPLFEALGQFDHERAHDVLASGLSKVVTHVSASDPVAAQVLATGVKSLEKAYMREVRPDAKARIFSAYATLCVWIMPPVADSNLMANINASLERLTGEKVGFLGSDDPLMQKLSLVEWVERLLKTKRIPKRPTMPPAVEEAVKEILSPSSGDATPSP